MGRKRQRKQAKVVDWTIMNAIASEQLRMSASMIELGKTRSHKPSTYKLRKPKESNR